jgi:hypothetical protein
VFLTGGYQSVASAGARVENYSDTYELIIPGILPALPLPPQEVGLLLFLKEFFFPIFFSEIHGERQR